MAKKRAIISCSDKMGLVPLVKDLMNLGWEIISTGGTFRHLKEHGIMAKEVQEVTGFPEILSGRVKTLHPRIHGGILARRDNDEDMEEIGANDLSLVDMVVCNLYPFLKTAQKPNVTLDELIEEIDIGGPTLLRAAAKNHRWVIPVVNPQRYPSVVRELVEEGEVSQNLRRILALEVFNHTAKYDTEISSYLELRFKNFRA